MDALNNSDVEMIVMMSSAQVGKTEILNNVIGYFMSQDPAPMLMVQPTLQMAEAYSKDRLSAMLRDTPCLKNTVKDPRTRDSGNTLLHKTFPGGHVTMAGSNSPASLASRPVRVVLCDEVDRYEGTSEGDPVDLAHKRTTTFWNRKIMLTSTPGIKGLSRIESAYEQSDMRKYHVPCPHCNEFQILVFGQIKWPKERKGKNIRHITARAYYECEHCGCDITEVHRQWMVSNGEWRAQADFNGTAGFWINELYSPWVSFSNIAEKFLQAKKGGQETLRVFVNTSLAETWEESGESVDDGSLFSRRERYGPKVPLAAVLITAGVDVQDDRLEVETVAWGKGVESWNLEYKVFYGDPGRTDVWNDLDIFLQKLYTHESGAKMKIAGICVDSGGHHTIQVYEYVKPRQIRRIWAIKGRGGMGVPVTKRPSTRNKGRVKLFLIGVDGIKESIYARLKVEEFGPGFMHFPLQRDEEYFKQLTAEKIITRYVKGFPKREWVKSRSRNEALDCRVYATAALAILNPDMSALIDNLKHQAAEEKEKKVPPKKSWKNGGSGSRGGFANRWRK